MSKNAQITQCTYMHKIIPYRYCYEEGRLTEKGLFTRTYEVIPPREEVKGSFSHSIPDAFNLRRYAGSGISGI